jgi:hypothetical protein
VSPARGAPRKSLIRAPTPALAFDAFYSLR